MKTSFIALAFLYLTLHLSACTPTFHQNVRVLNKIPFKADFQLKKRVKISQELSTRGTEITVLSDCGPITCKQMQGELFGFTDQQLFVLEPKTSCLKGVSVSSVDYLVLDNAYHIDVLGFNERLFSLDRYARFRGNLKSSLEPFFLKCILPNENPKDHNKKEVTRLHKTQLLTPKRTAGINILSRSLQKDWSLRFDMGGGLNLNFDDSKGFAESFTGLISFRPTLHLFSWLRVHLRADLSSKTRSGATLQISDNNLVTTLIPNNESEESQPQESDDIRFSRKSHFLI